MKIVITDADTVKHCDDISLECFREFGELEIYGLTEYDEIAHRIKDADIVLCNKTRMDEKVLTAAENLKYIGLFATGYNNIDLAYTKAHGITVCNAPGYSTASVAQHTFALILEFFNRVNSYNQTVKSGDWKNSRTFSYFPIPLAELQGKTLGIVGFGDIGQNVYAIAKAFGMDVLVYTRTEKAGFDVKYVDFDTLLEKSDIVSVHCPLTPQTDKMFNSTTFGKMKPTAIFINTARGGIVDEIALRDALKSGKIAGAGIDVLSVEPMQEDCVLYGLENCIITPHIAWAGKETRQRLIGIVHENIKRFIEGKPINIVG